jgi:serine/threonine protein kinase
MGVIFFIFLTGNMPFKEDKCNQIILNQHRSLRLYWVRNPKISVAVRHLIKSIFTFDWMKRPTIAEIASSQWLLCGSQIAIEYNLRPRFKPAKRIDNKPSQLLATRS